MPTPISKATPQAIDAYLQHLATIRSQLEALQQLHEGSIARYRLRRSEYIAWQHAQAHT